METVEFLSKSNGLRKSVFAKTFYFLDHSFSKSGIYDTFLGRLSLK